MRYLVLGLVLGAAAACSRSPDDGNATSGEIQPVVGARTAVVTTRHFEAQVAAIGTVTQRPGHFAALSSPVPTRVARVFVTLGQAVKAGDPLVEFEQQRFDAELQSANVAVDNAQATYDRASRLADEGVGPRKDVELAAAALAQAKATAVTARRDQELSTLRAPLDGVVTVMNAVLGQSTDPTQVLVEVTDPHALDVMLSCTGAQAVAVRGGQSVALFTGQSGTGQQVGTGRVASVGVELDSATSTVPVRVAVTTSTRPLRVGETVMGRIVTGARVNAVGVPVEALVPDGEGYHVFVVDSAGIAHARTVTVGIRGDAYAEVLSGLEPGETVVTHGAYGVTDSARIVRSHP